MRIEKNDNERNRDGEGLSKSSTLQWEKSCDLTITTAQTTRN